MLLVIFGAGSSYDSAPNRPVESNSADHERGRPPLTDDLFVNTPAHHETLGKFPRVLPLVPRLVNTGQGKSLEAKLADLENESRSYPKRRSDIVSIIYYLHRRIMQCDSKWIKELNGITNFLSLLDAIQVSRGGGSSGVIFSTFNYDRLFEYAASRYISNFSENESYNSYDTLDSYITYQSFPLIKLHGSVDWGYTIDSNIDIIAQGSRDKLTVAKGVIEKYMDIRVSDRIKKISVSPPELIDSAAHVPALALPVQSKMNFVCPPSHLHFLWNALHSVSHILVIGWRAMEDHFLSRLREELKREVRIMAVCGNQESAKNTLSNINGYFGFSEGIAYSMGFSEIVLDTTLELFLRDALND